MNFSDIFKNSFLGEFSYVVDTKTIAINLSLAAAFSIYIFFVYRLMVRKTFYSRNFNISLVGMAIITAGVILTIQSNVVLSLGMVGALSIVRFRTAVKDPMDLVFLYWSLSIGIMCGAGLAVVAIAVSLIVTAIIFIIQVYPQKRASMILVVNATSSESDKEILQLVKQYCKYYKVKSKNLTPNTLDMVIELNINAESELINELVKIDNVKNASILSHDGEITAS